MNKENKVIAILTADWHLSHKPPVWRSNEPNWYEAMQRPLNELDGLQNKYKCPILVAGDIFDKWNSPPELINFAIKNMPECVYAIPGQHDLTEHSSNEIERSAYFSLVLSGIIKYPEDAENGQDYFNLHDFDYGQKIEPPIESENPLDVAIIHQYVWTPTSKYPNAPKESKITKNPPPSKTIGGKLYGYDVIVYGDNHKSFYIKVGKTSVFNCGTLMRRASDEKDYEPRVGLLYSNGNIEFHYLDTSQDKHLTTSEMKDVGEKEYDDIDMEEFAEELRKLGVAALDFTTAMKEFWRSNKTRKTVQSIILKAMEK